jgi:hypothetical protein
MNMLQRVISLVVVFFVAGCSDSASIDNIEFVKQNLANKNLEERMLTIEQFKDKSSAHQALYQQIKTSYDYMEKSKTADDPFTAYQYSYLARKAYFMKEIDAVVIQNAKALEEISAMYRRITTLQLKEQKTDWLTEKLPSQWDIYQVTQSVKNNATVIDAVEHGLAVKKQSENPMIDRWMDHVLSRKQQELSEIATILVLASDYDKENFFKDKREIEQEADRILAGITSDKAREIMKPNLYAWQHKNLWRYELVNNTCYTLRETIYKQDITKDCEELFEAYKAYTIEPENFENFAYKSRRARAKLTETVEKLKNKYILDNVEKRANIKPDETLDPILLSLRKDIYRAGPEVL